MILRPRSARLFRTLAAATAILALSACGSGTPTPSAGGPSTAIPSPSAIPTSTATGGPVDSASPMTTETPQPSSAEPSSTAPQERVPLTVGLGYIPSIQFSQFYYAEQAGYYQDEGLDVTFEHKIDPELITLLGQGAVDISISDGTSLIPAVSQQIPVQYVATIYASFPNVVFGKASSGITQVSDLRGVRLGTPGYYGSSWFMLQALLRSADLTPDDLNLQLYPDFGQGAALQQGAIDAATGFANNEPILLEQTGEPAFVLRVDEIIPLPGPGLVVGTVTLEQKADALARFVAVTLRAMDEIIADPQKGYDATVARVPELASDPAGQMAILEATAAMWHSEFTEANGLGAINRDGWSQSIEFMTSLPDAPVANPVELDQLVTDQLLPENR